MSMMPGPGVDTGAVMAEDTVRAEGMVMVEGMVMAEGMVMVEGMDSAEVMALMGIMGIAEAIGSTGTMEDMVSIGIMDSTAVSVSVPHLAPGLIGDTTHTTHHHADTPSPSTGTTALTPRATTHTSRTAGPLGC